MALKIGDRVTGTDRTYKRSIYEVVSQKKGMLTLKLVCFNGQLGIGAQYADWSKDRPVDEFRLATDDEVYSELAYAYKVHVVQMVKRLLRVRRSFLGRRSLG